MAACATLDVGGRRVAVSNLDKVFYPQCGFTKGEVIDYYIKIASALLPHLAGRPLSLKRYPDGVEGDYFYEKRCPGHRPEWIKTIKVATDSGETIDYCAMNTLADLVWVANLADLELHTFLHKAPALKRPTMLAFDLDPGAPADVVDCCEVALWVKEIFAALGMQSFAKTSGSKGLQVYVPLNSTTSGITYARTKAFARAIVEFLAHQHPKRVVSQMKKEARVGKVFIDWRQNDDKKTTVNVYSLRATAEPTVSTPVTWDEVKAALKSKTPLSFGVPEVLKRVQEKGDLFAPVLELQQELPRLDSNSFKES